MMEKGFNYGRFFLLLRRGFGPASAEMGDDLRASLVSQYTEGRTTSLREMEPGEYERMCRELEERVGPDPRVAEMRRLRSECLRLMQKLGIDTTDWVRVNAFCRDGRIAGVEFRRLSGEELERLAAKLRLIMRKGGLKPKADGGPPVIVCRASDGEGPEA